MARHRLRSSLTLKSKAPSQPTKRSTLFDGDGLTATNRSFGERREEELVSQVCSTSEQEAHQDELGNLPSPLPLAKSNASRDEYLSLCWLMVLTPKPTSTDKAKASERVPRSTRSEPVARKWLDEQIKTAGISEDHAADIWRSLRDGTSFPALGDVPVNEIRPKLLRTAPLTLLSNEAYLETLRRIISRLNEIFRWAATEELIEFNPADNLGQRFSKPKKQNMPALPPSELPRFMESLTMRQSGWKHVC